MHSPQMLQQTQRPAVRAPFSSSPRQQQRSRAAVRTAAAGNGGEAPRTTIHKIIADQGQVMVPGASLY
jgi:hypothetical protein